MRARPLLAGACLLAAVTGCVEPQQAVDNPLCPRAFAVLQFENASVAPELGEAMRARGWFWSEVPSRAWSFPERGAPVVALFEEDGGVERVDLLVTVEEHGEDAQPALVDLAADTVAEAVLAAFPNATLAGTASAVDEERCGPA